MVLFHFYCIFYFIFKTYIFFPKSQKENEKWTFLKMSKIQNLKKVLKIAVFFIFDHNALICIFDFDKFVMLFFFKIIAKTLGVFFVDIIYGHFNR